MGIYDRIYREEHRQLSRIATFSSIYSKIPICGILVLTGLGFWAFASFGQAILGLIASVAVIIWLRLKLMAKHSCYCPKCKKPFFGEFKLFMPYVDRCQNCGFLIIPDEPVNLDIKDM